MENTLKKYRLENSLTQKEVANHLGITERHYRDIEAGTSDGSVKLWKRLSKLLNVSLDILLEQDV